MFERLTELWGHVRMPSWRAVACLVASAALLGFGPAPARSVSRVEGYVRLTSASNRPVASGVYPSRRVSAPVATPAPEMQKVVVFIKNAPAGGDLRVTTASIAQRNEAFVPSVLAITSGSTVEFPNFDPYFHNVFSLSRAASFDLGRFPRGDSRSRRFTASGLVKVYCHIHSHMSASILVFDHSFFQIPDTQGWFSLDGVPAGDYQISAWHERIGESVHQIRVKAGERTRVEFSLPVVER